MVICFVGPANSVHIIKWCKWFVMRGHTVHVISFCENQIPDVEVHGIGINVNTKGNDFSKLRYLLTGRKLKSVLDTIRPDVVSVHYATSYGVSMALSGYKPYTLSMWGSDIFEFPNKSPLHRLLLKYSLNKADMLLSTSRAMANEAHKYVDSKIEITPFGIDTNLFSPKRRDRKSDKTFVVGTVKSLHERYGIDTILKAAYILKKRENISIEVRIAGIGPREKDYKQLAEELGLKHDVTWLGFISQEQAAIEWANMDVALIPSNYESFGVAALESQSCGTATIVTSIPGLMEATIPGKTSITIQKGNAEELARAIKFLHDNPQCRSELGEQGRTFVENKYELNTCFEKIEQLLKTLI